jgi:lysophospholipase L1-like esterase
LRGQLIAFGLAAAFSLSLAAAGMAVGIGPPVLRLVVLGDSLTATLDAASLQDDPSISWATGERLGAPSIVQRLAAEGWEVDAANVAKSGDRAADLHRQIEQAPSRADVVLVWIGTNDLCMPQESASQFAADLDGSFDALRAKFPDAQVLVFAPPSLVHIGRQHEGIPAAVHLWTDREYCTHFFGPARNAGVAADRQGRFDSALETAAAEHGFHHSRALQRMNRPLAEWATWDYLHPSPTGSALFAERAWPDVSFVAGPPTD